MNTNLLKKFAQETRIRLLEAVEDKLNYILNGDSAGIRDYTDAIQTLKKDLKAMGKEALIDKVAYTWFNRLMALRFMDVNDYQPLGLKVISPKPGYTQPELLDEATQGHIPEELDVDRERIHDLLDGNIDVLHPQNEIYRMLLIASCNYLHGLFPFLFEKIGDYTELLLPDDLISELSILLGFVQGMTEEDCQKTEMIGWLYQFYISEKKDEVFAKRGRVEKDEIPAATQLFTPRWIVEYMVQNTVGKLWLQNNPDSALREKMPYYIETKSSKGENYLKIDSPEEITLLDQACGSGHILVYGFELLYQIYEEAGYTASQIPQLIIKKNLVGYEIDERAAQLASFSILMKARSYYRRLFRKTIQPHILCFQDLRLTDDEIEAAYRALDHEIDDDLKYDLQCMQQGTNFGSLIQPKTSPSKLKKLKEILQERKETDDLFLSRSFKELYTAISQLIHLSQKFHCIVDNPPYMGSGNMNPKLSTFVRENYPDSKADLMACFMESGLTGLHPKGFLGMINQHSWMFLSSYEKLRKKLIKNTQFDTLLHLGPRTFPEIGGEVVQNAAFTFTNKKSSQKGSYLRLINYNSSEEKRIKTLETIQNPECGWFYTADQKDFEKIPGSNIGYWLSLKAIKNLEIKSNISPLSAGLNKTANNDRYLRFNWEIESNLIGINNKWINSVKGGKFRRWFGNMDYLNNWTDKALNEIRKSNSGSIIDTSFIGAKGFSWTSITAGKPSFRLLPSNFTFNNGGLSLFIENKHDLYYIIGFCNSCVFYFYNTVLNPTLNVLISDILNIPIVKKHENSISEKVRNLIEISQQEWNSRETSWDFEENELIRMQGQDIEEAIYLYKEYWTKKFIQLHRNEEELNARFIEIYGLQEELTPDVPLTDITILREELNQRKLKKISGKFSRRWELVDGGREAPVDGEMVDSGWGMVNGGREAPVDGEMVDGGGVDDEMVDGGRWMVDGEEVPNDQAPITNYQSLKLPFDEKELVKQFISYAVGCMMGRYSLDKPGLILANQGEGIADYVRMVDSGWGMVDGGQWIVDGGEGMDGKNLKNIDDGKGLQGTKDLATRDGSSKDGLSDHEKDAERGTIQPDGSDQTSSRERTEQYSRRASERNPGISSFSSDRTGITGRAGDPTDPDNKSRNAGRDRSESHPGSDHQPEKANLQSAESSETENKNQPLIPENRPPFMPDDDGIIPVLDSEWFEDDIVTQFRNFVRVVWGEQNLKRNMKYIEKTLGKPVRDYFYRDFYDDHVRRYQKRPIYWLFTSPDRSFQALVYLHRYNRDTLNILLNDYLRPYIHKLENHVKHLNHLVVEGSAREQTRARKEIVRTEKMIEEARKYDRDVVYPLALRRIEIDLDDGVLVNYNKFGEAVKRVQSLNDPKKKAQVKKFDWIDGSEIV